MSIIEQIKAEIERLKDENNNIRCAPNKAYCQGYGDAFVDLLPFLDTLESEKPSEGLEEELDRFIASGKSVTVDDCGTYKVSYHDFKKVACHFAEWQKEQDEKEQAELFTIVALDAAQRAKEQMMKEAVEAEISAKFPIVGRRLISVIGMLEGFKYGDKVRIIVLKNTEK